MRILLSAYMCEPYQGSESEVGWRWATGLAAQGHEVVLLTRSTHQESVLREALREESYDRIQLVAFDVAWKPAPAYRTPRGIRLHYLAWQWKALRIAKRLQAEQEFDLVHHVTLASVRQPSFLGKLDAPFVFGPVGGGEQAPWRLLEGSGIDGWVAGAVRGVWNAMIRFDPLLRGNFQRADLIFCSSEETRRVLPVAAQRKAIVQLAVALDPSEFPTRERIEPKGDLRIINAGRFLHWKAMHLGMRAFAEVLKTHPRARLSMMGQGPKEADWRKLADQLAISHAVDWYGWVSRERLLDMFDEHHLCLYPSLHDSGGFVVLEAMAHQLPVVCFDLGGPGQMVDNHSGRVIRSEGVSADDAVDAMTNALLELAGSSELRSALGHGARRRAEQFTWERLQNRIYGVVTNSEEPLVRETFPGIHPSTHGG